MSIGVFISNRKMRSNQFLALAIIFTMANLLFSSILSTTNDQNIALWAGRLNWATVSAGMVALYYFIGYFPASDKQLVRFDRVLVLIAGAVLLYLSLFTSLIIKNVAIDQDSVSIVSGSLMNAYYIVFCLILIAAFYVLFRKYFRVSKLDKTKMNFFLIGLSVFITTTIVTSVLIPIVFGTDNYTFIGDYSVIIFLGFASYAIVRHGLFDVRLAIVRSVSYAMILVTLTGVYASITFVFSLVFNRGPVSIEQTAIGVISSIAMALLVQPLKRFFDKVTNKVFYKDNYSTDDFFARLNKTLSITTDLRGLLERTAYEIGDTLKAEQAFFFIYTTAQGNYITAGTEHHKLLPKVDAILIERMCSGKDDIVIGESLKDGDPVKRMMISHRIELILPLIQDGDVVGFLCLGEHKNSGYTNRDTKALDTISDELIIAIKNALAVHEIRELNLGLQQKIANATKELRSNNTILRQLDKVKDEFISMASHQLRTPLTSVKGYLSMVIEGDVGKITESQKKLLDQAFMSSENMVHLINDFLNVSRIQSGKFVIDRTPVDLSELVQQEVDSLAPNAKARNMRLTYEKPKDFPIMQIDEGKIRQVVMNFADNAIYYSHDDTEIVISLTTDGDEAIFKVKDTGIGVPMKERAQLFSKFYRASNAKVKRPDGTGVGIYLAKKVVDSLGGKIIFESVEGKGSTFGFRLPLNKN